MWMARSRHGSHGRAGIRRTSARTGPPIPGCGALSARACRARSAITGMPSPRRRPLLLAHTPAAPAGPPHGRAALQPGGHRGLSQLASTTRPSITCAHRGSTACGPSSGPRPAMPRRSAAAAAVRSPRPAPSPPGPSPGKPPSGPFTVAAAVAVAPAHPVIGAGLPFGSGVTACFAPQAHQTRVSAVSGRGSCPYPASYARTSGGGASTWFPVSCCLSATGIRFPGLPAPAGDCASLTVGLPAATGCRTPSGLSRAACMRYGQGGCPLNPRGTVVRSRPAVTAWPAPAAFQRPAPDLPPAAAHRREQTHDRQTCFERKSGRGLY